MTKEIEIEDLRGRGMTAEVTDTGEQYTTYKEFANTAGYPDASDGEYKYKNLYKKRRDTFKVLARGDHHNKHTTIYVIESEDDERFLVGDVGLKIHEPIVKESQLADMGYAELIRYTDEVNRALRRKVYAEAYEQGRIDGRMDALQDKPTPTDSLNEAYNVAFEVSPNVFRTTKEGRKEARERLSERAQKRRDEIVEKAKQFVKETTERTSFTTYEFIVDKPKRTVVVLRLDSLGKVLVHGKATSHPDDCFNVHIGKYIALRRAMFMDVPDEYLNIPQPTEVRVGDVIHWNYRSSHTYKVLRQYSDKEHYDFKNVRTSEVFTKYRYTNLNDIVKIIDDSREGVTEQ